jgi:NTE family protein
MSWRELLEKAQRLAGTPIFSVDTRVLYRGTRSPSLLREEPLRELIRALLPVSHFDELDVPLAVNAVDLASGELVWFGEGGRTDVSLADAVYASCALPLFFPPATIDGRRFIDGGIIDPLPIARARAYGGRVVAVDLAAPAAPACQSGMVDTYCRVFEILRTGWLADTAAEAEDDVVRIQPTLVGRNTFDLSRAENLIEAGYQATLARLAGSEAKRTMTVPATRPGRRGTTGWIRELPAFLARNALSR